MTMLKDVKVLDLTRQLPGPYCTWTLSKLGAEVLRIEDPEGEDLVRAYPAMYEIINAGKKSMTLNLKKSSGRKIFLDLVSKSDVLVEGFRPGVMDKLELSYETLREYNEKIIYCSISGYGQNGPYRDVVGHDINYMSICGLLGINGTPESPIIPGMQIGDIGGGIFGALSILASLYKMGVNGEGEYIDVSMMDVLSSFFSIAAPEFCYYEESTPERGRMLLTGLFPCYNIYKAKDGKFISLGANEPKFWNNFCLRINRADLVQRQLDTSAIEEVKKIFLEKTREEWVEMFKGIDSCLAPIYDPEETLNDLQINYRKVFDRKRKILNLPVKFLKGKIKEGRKAPEKGENTSEILKALGYKERNIEDLKGEKVI